MQRQVRYLRRMGQNPVGSVRLMSEAEGDWLVHNGHAEFVGGEVEHAEPAAPAEQPAPAGAEQADVKPPAPTLAQLQAQAAGLKLPTYGSKAQLADRIEQAQQAKAAAEDDGSDSAESEDQDDEADLDEGLGDEEPDDDEA